MAGILYQFDEETAKNQITTLGLRRDDIYHILDGFRVSVKLFLEREPTRGEIESLLQANNN